ncbi:MAG: Holliday junction resolvase RuvX [Acidobacteria bacterium]|nr:Holliday junction resolvase RuvX [Acidobacteriota bacterium]
MQEKKTTNPDDFLDVFSVPARGRLVALDPGTKRVGVAVSDELQFTVRPLKTIERGSWKKLLLQIKEILAELDAVGLVLGLPLETDGSESPMSLEARRLARNFSLSLDLPVRLHDERVTSYEARGRLWREGVSEKDLRKRIDSEAAALILQDFIDFRNQKLRDRDRAAG